MRQPAQPLPPANPPMMNPPVQQRPQQAPALPRPQRRPAAGSPAGERGAARLATQAEIIENWELLADLGLLK
jgi:hypothetical protein